MKELLQYLLENIVDKKDEIEISQTQEEGTQILHFKVASDEIGKVIGKGGKVIKSLRSALKVKAIPAHIRFQLILDETN